MKNKTTQSSSTDGNICPLSENDIRNSLIDALAQVSATDRADIEMQIATHGDVKTDSCQAEVMIAVLEKQVGQKLPGPADLRPEQFSSVSSLTNLVMQKLNGSAGTISSRTHTSKAPHFKVKV